MRKATHTFLAPEALQGYWLVQQAEYLRLLHDVLESPKVFSMNGSTHAVLTFVLGHLYSHQTHYCIRNDDTYLRQIHTTLRRQQSGIIF